MTQHNASLDIDFPPCPAVLISIQQEMNQSHPSIRKIADFIVCDVVLAAEVLKTVNSPFYGLRHKVSSVSDAIKLIGFTRTLQLVAAASVRQSSPFVDGLTFFWNDSQAVAIIACSIAKYLKMDGDLAYLMGLFHNCAVPLLVQRFPHYFFDLRVHHPDTLDITIAEDAIFNVNHALLGSLFARSWYLPDSIIQAIRFHHTAELFSQGLDSDTLNLVTVNLLAINIHDAICGRRYACFSQLEKQIRDYLLLSDDVEYQSLIDRAMEAIGQ